LRVIAGEAHGRKLRAPRGLLTRPATARVRASIFSRLAARVNLAGARVLDIFAGSGSLGFEALSRGAASVVFVDSSRAAAAVIARNLNELGLAARARILVLDFHRALAELAAAGEPFDLVFVDAPSTAKKLYDTKIPFVLSSRGVRDPADFPRNIRRMIDAGLPSDAALAKLTTEPAELLGLSKEYGTVEAGKVANLIVTDGDLFGERTRVVRVFVDGYEYIGAPPRAAIPGRGGNRPPSGDADSENQPQGGVK
jgi:16S rRNA (guanine(966)-N(2))-methyltransferase RsmD